jgi:hypothetical protein
MSQLTVDQVIAAYLKFRTRKKIIEDKAAEEVRDIKLNLVKLEAWLQAKADEDGVKSFKTDSGTAFVSTSDLASVGDWDAILKFIQDNDAWDMLERRVSKAAVRSYIDRDGVVPAGVNFGSKVSINVRRPTKKAG